jgi:hypothetical protein
MRIDDNKRNLRWKVAAKLVICYFGWHQPSKPVTERNSQVDQTLELDKAIFDEFLTDQVPSTSTG